MGLYETIAKAHPALARGQVWCIACGHTRRVNPSTCLKYGWPKCCGVTMTIDSPDEQRKLAALTPEAR
jgi:hypothetical protein